MRNKLNKWSYQLSQQSETPLVPELIWVGYVNYKEAYRLNEHIHKDSYEFVFIEYGTVVWEVDEIQFETNAGQVFHSRPNEWHRPRFNYIEPCSLWYLIFRDPHTYDGWLGLNDKERLHFHQIFINLPRIFNTQNHIRASFEFLKRSFEQPNAIKELAIRHALLRLLFHFFPTNPAHNIPEDLQNRMTQVIQNIKDHPEYHWTISDLAREIHVSHSHIYRLFRLLQGESPTSFIQRCRIEAARKRLTSSNESITEIAMGLGFKTSQHFATLFKRFTGNNPREWRKMREIIQTKMND